MKAAFLLLAALSAAQAAPKPALGDWVCPDSAARTALASCPALVVSSGDSVEVIGAMGLRRRLPPAVLATIGRVSAAKVLGATESVHLVDNAALSLQLGYEGNFLRQAGLILQTGKSTDTVEFFDSGHRLGKTPGSCADSSAWAECLDAYPGYGLLHNPILPAWPKARPALSRWTLQEREGYRPRRAKQPGSFGSIRLFYQEHPKTAGQARFFETGTGAWIIGAEARYFALDLVTDTAARISESQTDLKVQEVSFLRRPKSKGLLAVVETGGSYSDGSFADLVLVSLPAGRDTLHAKGIPYAGSSGEPGGSTVEAAWWMGIGPGNRERFYVARTQQGNENGESEDLRLSAFDISASGTIEPVKASAFDLVSFGAPSEWKSADSLASALMDRNPKAKKAGLKALPLLSGGKLAWVAGSPAPDRATAKAWAAWAKGDKGGKVRSIKAAKRK